MRDLISFLSLDSGFFEIQIALPRAMGDSFVSLKSLADLLQLGLLKLLTFSDVCELVIGSSGLSLGDVSRQFMLNCGEGTGSEVDVTLQSTAAVFVSRKILSILSKKAYFFYLSSISSYCLRSSIQILFSFLVPFFFGLVFFDFSITSLLI